MTAGLEALALVVVAVAVLLCLVLLPEPGKSEREQMLDGLVRYSIVAALCAVLSGLMYFAFATADARTSLAIADATMVLAPAMLWTALRRVHSSAVKGVAVALLGGIVTFVSTLVAPVDPASVVKLGLVAAFCVLILVESRRDELARTRASAAFTAVGAMYGAYALARAAIGATLGVSSELYVRAFSTPIATGVSVIAIAGAATGVWMLRRELGPRRVERPAADAVEAIGGELLRQNHPVISYLVELPELALIRIAHGAPVASEIAAAVAAAIATARPDALVARSRIGDAFLVIEPWRRGAPSAIPAIRAAYEANAPVLEEGEAPELIVARRSLTTPAQLTELVSGLNPRRILLSGSASIGRRAAAAGGPP
jgi:hypothetical protein